MNEFSERSRLTGELESAANEFAAVGMQNLTRPYLGELQFTELEEDFQVLIDVAQQLTVLPLGILPAHLARRGTEAFAKMRKRIEHIQKFSVHAYHDYGNEPVAAHRQLVEAARDSLQEFYDTIAPVLGFAVGMRFSPSTEDAASAADVAKTKLRDVLDEAKANSAAISDLLRLAQENVQKVAVGRHAGDFSREADRQRTAGVRWLWLVAGLALATTVLALVNVLAAMFQPRVMEPSMLTQLVVAKLIVFSVLVSATVWCGRVYRAVRHNETVNRHRQNALSSFEAFAAAADDAPTRNTVLVQATQAIFAPQPSGFAEAIHDTGGAISLSEIAKAVRTAGR